MPVAVLFALQAASRVTIGEGDLRTAIDVLRDKIDPDHLDGEVVLMAAGQPVAYVEDDLEFTVQQLLEAVPELVAGRPFGLGFSEAPGRIDLSPAGAMVTVSGDYFRPLVAPAAELLPAALACCERFIAFGRATYAEHAGVLARLEQLDPWVSGARAALATGGRDAQGPLG